MKNSFKILVASITVLVLCSFGATASFASAYSYGKTKWVQNAAEFAQVVATAKSGDYIVLTDDISITNPIEIKASITVDLNGYKITVEGDDHGIICGNYVFDHTEYYTVEHPGKYVTKSKLTYIHAHWYVDVWGEKKDVPGRWITEYYDVWEPGWSETRSKDIYLYYTNINIVFKNGWIIQTSAKNGEHGKEDTFIECDGKNGGCKNAPVKALSGSLTLLNMRIQGANGGDGGNGAYQSLLHVPFGGGDAGKGGNGGNGAPAVEINSKYAKVFADRNSLLVGGKGGKGGLAGKPNPNYWVYSGFNGRGGVVGQNGSSFKMA